MSSFEDIRAMYQSSDDYIATTGDLFRIYLKNASRVDFSFKECSKEIVLNTTYAECISTYGLAFVPCLFISLVIALLTFLLRILKLNKCKLGRICPSILSGFIYFFGILASVVCSIHFYDTTQFTFFKVISWMNKAFWCLDMTTKQTEEWTQIDQMYTYLDGIFQKDPWHEYEGIGEIRIILNNDISKAITDKLIPVHTASEPIVKLVSMISYSYYAFVAFTLVVVKLSLLSTMCIARRHWFCQLLCGVLLFTVFWCTAMNLVPAALLVTDVCVDPVPIITRLAKEAKIKTAGVDVEKIITYYTTCKGENPFQPQMAAMLTPLKRLNNLLKEIMPRVQTDHRVSSYQAERIGLCIFGFSIYVDILEFDCKKVFQLYKYARKVLCGRYIAAWCILIVLAALLALFFTLRVVLILNKTLPKKKRKKGEIYLLEEEEEQPGEYTVYYGVPPCRKVHPIRKIRQSSMVRYQMACLVTTKGKPTPAVPKRGNINRRIVKRNSKLDVLVKRLAVIGQTVANSKTIDRIQNILKKVGGNVREIAGRNR